MRETSWSGGCLCGSTRYVASGQPKNLCYCHCTSCRRAFGAPAVPWGTFDAEHFVVTRGELANYRSSPDVTRGFCARCGSSLTYRNERREMEVDVALATLDHPDSLAPAAHIWTQDKLPWVSTNGLPQFPTGQTADGAPLAVVRPGFRTVNARIVARDAARLVAFVREVFAGEGTYRSDVPTELRLGDSTILISDANARAPMPAFLYVYVADADATYERALGLGALSLEAPALMPYGDRRAMAQDPWGNIWQIATYPSS